MFSRTSAQPSLSLIHICNVILNAVRCAEILQLEHLVSKHAADNADDEFKDKGGDGIARITGDVYKRQAEL